MHFLAAVLITLVQLQGSAPPARVEATDAVITQHIATLDSVLAARSVKAYGWVIFKSFTTEEVGDEDVPDGTYRVAFKSAESGRIFYHYWVPLSGQRLNLKNL